MRIRRHFDQLLGLRKIAFDHGTAAGSAGASTLNKTSGVITTEALATAAGGQYSHVLTNANIAVGDLVFVTVGWGTNSQGETVVARVQPGAGTVTILIRNSHASQALNGTLLIGFVVVKAA